MKTRELADEIRSAVANLTDADRRDLAALGIPVPIIDIFQLIGIERIRASGGLYEPDSGGRAAFVTPVLAHHPDTPETPETPEQELFVVLGNLLDLIAWDPRAPSRWLLRKGSATWLGCIKPQFCEPAPVRVWRSPLDWLRNGLTGLVILSHERSEIYRLLAGCRSGIVADDFEHARYLQNILEHPWPAPTVHAAIDFGTRYAA